MNPEDVAGIAIKKMFAQKKVIVPGFWNNVIKLLNSVLPQKIKQFLINVQLKRIEYIVDQKKNNDAAAYPEAA